MASPHTGYRNSTMELLRVETNLFNLYIQGKPSHPAVETLRLHRDPSDAWVDSSVQVDVLTSKLQMNRVRLLSLATGELEDYETGQRGEPIFFETQSYELVIEKKQELPIQFHHDNLHLRQAIRPLGKYILSGVLNFQNEIGLTEFEIQMHGQSLLRLQLEIFPSKMDYKRDYEVILQDVNQQIYNLSFDFLRKTYQLTGLRETSQQSMTEYVTILQHVFSQLMQAVERIHHAPHHTMGMEQRLVDAGRAKRVAKHNRTYLAQRPHKFAEHSQLGFIQMNGKRLLPTQVLESRKIVDYDTTENRFIRWLLLRISNKLKELPKQLSRLERKKDEMLIKKLDVMQTQLRRVMAFDFLQVRDMSHLSVTLVLQMAPGYREVYRYYLMLMKGLSIQGDLLRLSMKDLAQLYEYWCFLKITQLLGESYELVSQDIIKVDRSGLFVRLSRGQQAKMVYRNPGNGEVFTLYYNGLPKGDSTPTLSQRPDNVLTLKKNDAATEYKYIFDAKYRLNPAYEGSSYHDKYKQPGPEEDDINTMHRYRDAIVYDGQGKQVPERSMFGAYVLFPYSEEERFRSHAFYRSIELVNIGAFPFLPGSTDLMRAFLAEIIHDSPEKAFERATRPRGTGEYYQHKLVGKNVLVGSLREPSQLYLALEHEFYHMPLRNIEDHRLLTQIEYIAMCQSRKKFKDEDKTGIHWYGKVSEWKVVKRREITERPARSGTGEELYVRFRIESWHQLPRPIALGGQGIYTCLYTTKYMLDRALEIAELKLEDDVDLRKWREVRRSGKVKVDLDHEHVDLARNVVGIRVE
ncbi:restriction endonuclease-like protein [Paenibacillus daejeonensis]|uniref:restriction endonuclease-like protein n=1 Tax=Paenibacillus daejeonensis TaxID=135193 RepID=UPI0003715703|nr:restriction endonuclease-like protein [Paenibacillus daejeonensis]